MPLRIPRASLFSPLERYCLKPCRLSQAVPSTHYEHQRAHSTFGYHQASALVYSLCGDPSDVLELHKYSIRPPHGNLVTLRTLASPINPSDHNQIEGKYEIRQAFTDALATPAPSAVPGNEGCFEVIATGSSVTTVAKGDWVIPRTHGLGTWRTHLQVDADSVMRIDKDGLTQMQVATVSVNPVTAWRLLTDFVDLRQGGWFIQNAANSAVGRVVLQLAKLWGFKNIAIVRDQPDVTSGTVQLKKYLKDLGASMVFIESETQAPGFEELVKGVLKGEKLALGLNAVGGRTMSKMSTLLSDGAQLVTYGNMSQQATRLSARSMIFHDIVYRGFWLTRWAEKHVKENEKTVNDLLDLMRNGKLIKSLVTPVPWRYETPKEDLLRPIINTFGPWGKQKDLFIFPEESVD